MARGGLAAPAGEVGCPDKQVHIYLMVRLLRDLLPLSAIHHTPPSPYVNFAVFLHITRYTFFSGSKKQSAGYQLFNFVYVHKAAN